MKCSKEKLIRVWYESESSEEVAHRTGLSISTVKRYVWQLRKQGVRLDEHKSDSRKEDIKKLVTLSETLASSRESSNE